MHFELPSEKTTETGTYNLVFVCVGLLFFWSLGKGLEDVGVEIMAMVVG
jgi:hypothetical protein